LNQCSETQKAVIVVRDLHKAYGYVHALDGLSFTVNRGDIYGFLGPNGSGKSTTIRILLSLVRSDSGTVNLFDQSMPHARRQILPRVGALIERPDFYEHLSALRNLLLLSAYSPGVLTESRIRDVLQIVGLSDRAMDKVRTFSDGMKQRLGIAQALMHKPELIILDEPFNSLDPQGVKDIRDLIVRLNSEQGVTVLLSSHKLDEIEKVATRMVMIDHGKAIEEGPVFDLISDMSSSIRLKVNSPAAAKSILEKSNLVFSRIEFDEMFLTVFSNMNHIPEIIDTLSSAGIKIYSVTDNHSLEELFLSLTAKK
jgi:ABC-2 type transport system ATP-binding protein